MMLLQQCDTHCNESDLFQFLAGTKLGARIDPRVDRFRKGRKITDSAFLLVSQVFHVRPYLSNTARSSARNRRQSRFVFTTHLRNRTVLAKTLCRECPRRG